MIFYQMRGRETTFQSPMVRVVLSRITLLKSVFFCRSFLYRKKKRLNIIDFPEGLPEAPVDLDGGTMLAACMARLPVRYRQVLLLKYSYGFSNKELAKLLGVTEANAIKLGQRAKEKFQEICEEEGVLP